MFKKLIEQARHNFGSVNLNLLAIFMRSAAQKAVRLRSGKPGPEQPLVEIVAYLTPIFWFRGQ